MIPLARLQKLSHQKQMAFIDARASYVVRIYSSEHSAYWRPNGMGYTYHKEAAGTYSLHDAYDRTHHCGPEKEIWYEVVNNEYHNPGPPVCALGATLEVVLETKLKLHRPKLNPCRKL